LDTVPLSTRRQLELMQQLQELADERAEGERNIAAAREGELAAADEHRDTRTEALVKECSQCRRDLENEYSKAKQAAEQSLRDATAERQSKFQRQCKRIKDNSKQILLAIERRKKESEWQALAVFDAGKDLPGQKLAEATHRLQARASQIDGLERDADTLVSMRRLAQRAQAHEPPDTELPPEEIDTSQEPEVQLQTAINDAHQAVLDLQDQRLPALLLEDWRWVGWWAAASLLVALGALPFGLHWWSLLVGIVGGGALTAIIYATLGGRLRRHTLDQFAVISNLVQRARRWEQLARHKSESQCQQETQSITSARDQELLAAENLRASALEELENKKTEELDQTQSELDAAIEVAKAECASALAIADENFPPQLDALAQRRTADLKAIDDEHELRTHQAHQTFETDWQAMAGRWQTGFKTVADELAEMSSICQHYFPDWSTTSWQGWQRPDRPPEAMQFGNYRLPLQAVKQGVSKDPRLVPEQTELLLPALMTFSEQPTMMITAEGEGRKAAVGVLQSMMLRFLTAMPAGKLRLTIVDPSALGENFATFMHLADFDEQLVGGRIWTDSRQIDERLTLLSNHMEKVLQKYLRNDFDSIQEYNEQAGEVAEPYHVLVVANFPAGLSDASIRKLATIASTGPRCGVYTLMSIDTGLKLSEEYQLEQWLAAAVHLEWKEGAIRWHYPLYEKLPLKLDPLPPREKLNDLLRVTAQESREASRVEVPFDVVAPSDEKIWSGSTAHELVVPIGRAGANELQSVRLGRGTAQHVLISGKTGSGKSTLLHALVTNLALCYSPNELEFYLVDFKKGVEFKAYATGRLPHARVIAIESEREFGVSVLERLDEELRRRGEKFRELGVQDLAGFRSVSEEPMPRVLLIVDEFQELFVTDDKLSQDAALLLDRLVRQGRAFGMHVLLGSQTLAGAYSLARSTLGQMAVRVALECSEADAHLILSDDNTAARLLSRPGEAIYNDQNGLVEGNSLFQVVWLEDAERQSRLAAIRARLESIDYVEQPPIVFEGNVPADPRDNPALVEALGSANENDPVEPTIWLGSAVRIEPPTQLTLRRQAGQNLLVVGQDEPLALGILATSVCALAAQQSNTEFQLTLLDGTRPESSQQGAWTKVAEALPGKVQVFTPRETDRAIAALSAELERRTHSGDTQFPAHYLVVHDLAQFRDLRVSEEEFSFSSSGNNGKPPALDKQFRELLREGPAVGVHVLVWCDSYNSMNRSIDRLTLREIDFRVALQMSPGDSTSLIESPAAGRLGEHRSILYRDDLGTQQKFRPYRAPTADWLAHVGEQLAAGKLTRS